MSTFSRLSTNSAFQFFAALCVYFVATALITLPFMLRLDQTLFNWGDALLQTWTLGWNAQQFFIDPLNLYNAPTFYPYPYTLAFTDTLVPQSVIALPLILLIGNLPLVHNLSIVLAFVLNGANMYLLLRWWKLKFWGALVGGFIYAFGHYHLSHFGHLDLLSSQWLPLILLFFDLALERKQLRYFVLLSAAFLLNAMSAFYYAFFASVVVLCYALVRMWQLRGKTETRAWLQLGATFAVTALIVLPFGLPYISLARDFGLSRPFAELQRMSAAPASYLTLNSVNEPFASFMPFFPQVHPEAVVSPGILALALAAYGIVRRKNWRPANALIVIGFVAFFLSLGPAVKIGAWELPLPNQILYTVVPGFAGAMRAISRWGLIVLFAVAGLAGFAFDDVSRRVSRKWFAPALGIVVLALLYWEYDQAPLRLMTGTLLREQPSQLYAWLKTQPEGAAVELPMGEKGSGTANDFWYQYFTLLHRHRIVNGSSGFAPLTYREIETRLEHFPTAEGIELLRALNVRYVLLHTNALEHDDALSEKFALYHDALRVAQTAGTDIALEIIPPPSPPPRAAHWEFSAPVEMLPNESVRAFLIAQPAQFSTILLSERGLLDVSARWYDTANALVKTETARVTAPLLLNEHGTVLPFSLNAPTQNGTYHVILDVRGAGELQTLEQNVNVNSARTESDPPIQLVNAHIGSRAARAGETLKIILQWRTLAQSPKNYSVFLHLDDEQGNTRAQLDMEPFYGALPTTQWQAGNVFVEQYEIPLAAGLPQGSSHLVAGMFDASNGELISLRGPDDEITNAVSFDAPVYIGAGRAQKTLTPASVLRAEFDNAITLLGYELAQTQFKRGETIPLTLFWQARLRPNKAQTVFVHLTDSAGNLVAQADAPPRDGAYPTTAWNDGEYVRDPHPFVLPKNIAEGEFTMRVGWYTPEDGTRALIQNADGTTNDYIELGAIRVTNE